jgi:hypothetical protein
MQEADDEMSVSVAAEAIHGEVRTGIGNKLTPE